MGRIEVDSLGLSWITGSKGLTREGTQEAIASSFSSSRLCRFKCSSSSSKTGNNTSTAKYAIGFCIYKFITILLLLLLQTVLSLDVAEFR